MHRLTKKFRFETAHRLGKGYNGKCANIHGHSWNGEITVDCESLDGYGFGIDFGELKKFTKAVEDKLDHGLILHEGDSELAELCVNSGWKIVTLPDNPTCEVLAAWIFDTALEYFSLLPVTVYRVTIEETCTSRCEYYGKTKER